ncbi:MAG: hypothetical protein ACR2RD_07765 [Woeseiaceae bacterium]
MCSQPTVVITMMAVILAACDRAPGPEAETTLPFNVVETPIGDVDFPVGCSPEAAPLVERGVALLHHMMYDEARFVFGMADDRDPDCAMAYWGQAMALIHPLWPDVPSQANLERGSWLVEKSLALGGHSERENAYLQTTRAYFEGGDAVTEAERLVRFEAAWNSLSRAHPDDLEARAFYSLALRAIADNSDSELRQQKQAGLIAESVLAEIPNHPGGHHYVIHAYDYPQLAAKAEKTADHYGEITPKVPHATHMMTHIYTRLGLWPKAVTWNTISADTAWDMCIQTGEINLHYTHALDYLAYAHLQMANDGAVLEILETAEELQPPYSETNRDASAYAFAALPARYVLERRDWQAAAQLQPREPASFPWEPSHDAYVAITYFARAIGLARGGRPDAATLDIRMLGDLKTRIAKSDQYWAMQIEIQEETARAWQAFAMGDRESGVERMAHAASLEAATVKDAVTPGEVLPSAELYGDMLLEVGRFKDALLAYETALARSPRRYNSLLGAARSAAAGGDVVAASSYYGELLEIAGKSTGQRESIQEAQAYLEG